MRLSVATTPAATSRHDDDYDEVTVDYGGGC